MIPPILLLLYSKAAPRHALLPPLLPIISANARSVHRVPYGSWRSVAAVARLGYIVLARESGRGGEETAVADVEVIMISGLFLGTTCGPRRSALVVDV